MATLIMEMFNLPKDKLFRKLDWSNIDWTEKKHQEYQNQAKYLWIIWLVH
jgi:hypothetical protein